MIRCVCLCSMLLDSLRALALDSWLCPRLLALVQQVCFDNYLSQEVHVKHAQPAAGVLHPSLAGC